MPSVLSAERNMSKKNQGVGKSTTAKITYAPTPTKRTPTANGSNAHTKSADAYSGYADVLRKQGYTYNGSDANTAFAYDPSRKTYTTAEIERARLGLDKPSSPTAPYNPGGSPGGGGGYYGGGGYGGGGGGVNPADYQKYAAAMKQLLQSSLMNGPNAVQAPAAQQNLLAPMIDPAVDKDIAAARSAYSGLAGQVSQVDPYLQLIASQAPQMDADLSRFAQSQGIGGDYGAQVTLANQDATNANANWQNLARILGQNHLAGQRSVIDTANLQGENIVQGFEGQRTNLHAMANVQQMDLDRVAQERQFQLAQQQAAAEYQARQQKVQAIMELIAAGLPYGQTPDLAGLI